MTKSLPLLVHIPRTGGTSLTAMLRAHFPNMLQLSERAQILKFLGMAEPERASFDLIAGHMSFGADAFIGRPCRYFVCLRDPVDRFVSSYFHARSNPANGLYRFAREHSLRVFAERAPTFMRDNGQTRRLAAYDWAEVLADGPFWWQRVPVGEVSRAMLDQAKANLDRSCVGLFERFAESVSACAAVLRLRSWDTPILNRAPRDDVEVDSAALEIIRARHLLDLELYAYAAGRFCH